MEKSGKVFLKASDCLYKYLLFGLIHLNTVLCILTNFQFMCNFSVPLNFKKTCGKVDFQEECGLTLDLFMNMFFDAHF